MPYKDPEKAREYHRQYYKKYQPEWRKKHPTYQGNYLREYRKANPDKAEAYEKNRTKTPSERRKEYMSNPVNKLKDKARRKLRYELKLGRIAKPTRCEVCRLELPLEPDHYDYSKPLDVTWVCRTCHLELTVQRLRLGIII